MLVELAMECRDFAMIAGKAFGREIPSLVVLDAHIRAATDRHFVPENDDA
jgi:hypothetical protein